MQKKITNISCDLIFFILLSYVYEIYIVKYYGYMGYVNESTITKYIISMLMISFISIVLINNNNKYLRNFMNLFLYFEVIPNLIMFTYFNDSWVILTATLLAFVVLLLVSKVDLFKVNFVKISFSIDNLNEINLFICVLYIVSIFLISGGSYFNLDFEKVYDLRRDVSSSLPIIFSYIISPITTILIPLGIIISSVKRKIYYICVYFIISMLIFAITANKAPLFYPVLVLIGYLMFNINNGEFIFKGFMIIIVMISFIDFWILDYTNEGVPIFGHLGALRTFIDNGFGSYNYIKFFADSDYYFWSQSKITAGLLSMPNGADFAEIIGYNISGSFESNFNTGFIGSGYANAGYLGIFVYSLLIGLFISSVSRSRVNKEIIWPMTIVPAINVLTANDLVSMFLTHGLLILFLYIGILNKAIR